MAALRTLGFVLNPSRSRDGDASAVTATELYDGARNGHGDVWRDLRREMARARRFGRSFALVRIGRLPRPGFASHLRTVDYAWAADGGTYVLLPEADREAAEGFVGRIRREVPDLVAGSAVSVAAFPDDGLTSGALLQALRVSPERRREPARLGSVPTIADAPPVHA